MCTKRFLALLEVDKIHNYIFATNKLKEIRGASYLLSEINEERTEQVLKPYSTAKKILSTGGVTKVVFDYKDQAYKFLERMQKIYQEELITASVTTHVEPINDDFRSAIERGEMAIRCKKEDKEYTFQVNTSGYYKICSLCGQYPASERVTLDSEIIWLCSSCTRKRQNSLLLKVHGDICKAIKEQYPEIQKIIFPDEFMFIGEKSHVENYMGFIYADANRMGEKLKLVTDSINSYIDFSQNLKVYTHNALVESIIESFTDYLEQRKHSPEVLLPILILILGGDDMMLVTTANSVLRLANKFSRKFQEKTKEKKIPEISMSVGVVISKTTFPIFSYVRLGEELLKSAKRLSRDRSKDRREVGTIDFMVVTSASSQSLERVREDTFYYKKEDTGERFWLTARPYTTNESNYDFNLDKLLDFAKKFKEKGFPRNKLKAMERYLRTGRENSILEFCTMKMRLKRAKAHHELLTNFITAFELNEQMPWRIKSDNEGSYYLSNLLDLVEIYEFV